MITLNDLDHCNQWSRKEVQQCPKRKDAHCPGKGKNTHAYSLAQWSTAGLRHPLTSEQGCVVAAVIAAHELI